MRVLVAEDDQKIAAFIVNGLKQAGFAVNHAADGENGLHMATTQSYDVAVIDIMLPKLDGLSLIERLRQQKINTPVIILSAKRSVDDRVRGLQLGSDDYMTKPFALSELVARVQALIRRTGNVTEPTRLMRRRDYFGLANERGRARRYENRLAAPRIFPTGIPHAPPGEGVVKKHDYGACLGL